MTNLIFPTAPYTSARFYTNGNKADFKNVKVSQLSL